MSNLLLDSDDYEIMQDHYSNIMDGFDPAYICYTGLIGSFGFGTSTDSLSVVEHCLHNNKIPLSRGCGDKKHWQ